MFWYLGARALYCVASYGVVSVFLAEVFILSIREWVTNVVNGKREEERLREREGIGKNAEYIFLIVNRITPEHVYARTHVRTCIRRSIRHPTHRESNKPTMSAYSDIA